MSDPIITPTPSDEEAAAIAAALVVGWPRPPAQGDGHPQEPDPRWRFSARWWNRPTAVSRQRPWRR
jgi:hypothetical protein